MSWAEFWSADFLKFFVPLAGAVLAWFVNERTRRAWEEYQRKEERYRQLLLSVRGFYEQQADRKLKQAFLDEVNLCWLYCSDDVIRNAYGFLNRVHTDGGYDHTARERALGELILAIRKDVLARSIVTSTDLTAANFRNLSAT